MVSILDIPLDVIRLFIIEIPDPKGFHSASRTCRLLRKVCNEKAIQDHALLKYRKKCVAPFCHGTEVYYTLPSGIKHGPWLYDLRFIKTWVYGSVEGYSYHFKTSDDRTQLLSRYKYVKGVKNGFCEQWNDRGIKISEGMLSNDLKDGLWKHWNDAGQPLGSVLWDGGCYIRHVPMD